MPEIENGHPHLELEREAPITERRSRPGFPRVDAPDDPRGHGRGLRARLRAARAAASDDVGGYDERRPPAMRNDSWFVVVIRNDPV